MQKYKTLKKQDRKELGFGNFLINEQEACSMKLTIDKIGSIK